MAEYRLEWYGDQVGAEIKTALADGLANWADQHEQAAKAQLAPGRGYMTGRGQRSIHAAAPGHDWRGDFQRAPGPELGGMPFAPEENRGRLIVAVGSGLIYMAVVNDALQYMERSHDQTIGNLAAELESAVTAAGYGDR